MSQPSGRAEELPAELQRSVQVLAYVLVGCTAVFIWDVLNNLRNDYMLLFKQRFHVASGAYVVSRVAFLVYLLVFTIFSTHPIQGCNAAYVAFSSFYPLSISASTFLFLFRVRAVYDGDRLVTAIFGFLWLIVVGTSMIIPFSGNAIGLGDPYECDIVNVDPGGYTGATGITLTLYDTLVFFAISYRLVSNFRHSEELTRGEQARAFFSGANLPAFSKAVFTDGQIYYMIMVVMNGVTILLVYIPSVGPPVYHGLLVVPTITLTTLMACRVYRSTRLGISGSWELSLPTLNSIGPNGNLTIPLSIVTQHRGELSLPTLNSIAPNGNLTVPLSIVTQHRGMAGSVRSEGDGSDSTGDQSGLASKAAHSTFSSGMHQDTGLVP
ncbi:hypothetical protein DFH09DRAFT_1030497 [Mycena vulgaris]|nr:hypothetical protein DFH09DRAFT_1030497 [Mycena vulgaris]